MLRTISRRRIGIYIALLLVCILFMVWITRLHPAGTGQVAPATRDWLEIQQSGYLHILVPYNQQDYYVQGDSTLGFVYELARHLGAALDIEVRIEPTTNWADALQALYQGRSDLLAEAMPRTAALDTTRYQALHPIRTGSIYLVQRRDSTMVKTDLRGLAHQTIYMPANAPAYLFVEHLSEELGDSIHYAFDKHYGSEQLAMKVDAKEISYSVCLSNERRRIEQHYPKLDCQTPLSVSLLQTYLVRRHAPVLRAKLDSLIDLWHQDGYIDSLAKRYQ